MFKRTLVLFENEEIFPEAISFARELALRMDSAVTFLMLVEMAFQDRTFLGSKRNAISLIEERAGKVLAEYSNQLIKDGISVAVSLRVGDPAQELLKFLAERPPFSAIIWGSSKQSPLTAGQLRGHWLGKIKNVLECPLLAVSSRDKNPGLFSGPKPQTQ